MYSVKLQNIKGIKELNFPFPEQKGVYLLTGANGCGKTSLLVALCRLGDKLAFKHYRVNASSTSGAKIDAYQDASVTYIHDAESVVYGRKGVRWTASPKSRANLIGTFPFVNTLFITTTGIRFFTQDVLNLKRPLLTQVSASIITPMNEILATDKFKDLHFITVKGKKGRQRQLHRNNKLYVIKDRNGNFYSELNFSLGERLLLNTLDVLENISPRTLLLIDEVELALHPIAQVKFYDYLKQKADEKNLAVVISTHSSSLIKHAENRIYLEVDTTGKVKVLENCHPAYILRSVSSEEDIKPDFIFFVEDKKAQRYLRTILLRFLQDERLLVDCKVICVGGYEQVVEMVQCYPSLNFEKKKIQAFLDKDVEDTYNDWEAKGNNRTEAEERKYNLFKVNHDNISYLSITPELGIWEWMEQNPNIFKNYLDSKHGVQSFNVKNIIEQTVNEELPNKTGNPRKWAKGCFKNFTEKIQQANPLLHESEVESDMITCYVDNNYDLQTLRGVFMQILHR